MKLFNYVTLLLPALAYSASTNAFANVNAGEATSGGGAVIYCANHPTEPKVQMLENYEAKILHNLQIQESRIPYEIQLNEIIERFQSQPFFYRDLKETQKRIFASRKELPPGVHIDHGTDLGRDQPVIKPAGCELLSVGYYSSDSTLYISKSLYEEMSETQKAMFFFHEITYALGRFFSGHDNSYQTRLLTAKAFAGAPARDDVKGFTWKEDVEGARAKYWQVRATQPVLIPDSTNQPVRVKISGRLFNPEADSSILRIGCLDRFTPLSAGTLKNKYKIDSKNPSQTLVLPSDCQALAIQASSMSSYGGTLHYTIEFKRSGKILLREDFFLTGRLIQMTSIYWE